MTALYLLRWFDQLSVTEYRSKISLRDDSDRGTVETSGSGPGTCTVLARGQEPNICDSRNTKRYGQAPELRKDRGKERHGTVTLVEHKK